MALMEKHNYFFVYIANILLISMIVIGASGECPERHVEELLIAGGICGLLVSACMTFEVIVADFGVWTAAWLVFVHQVKYFTQAACFTVWLFFIIAVYSGPTDSICEIKGFNHCVEAIALGWPCWWLIGYPVTKLAYKCLP